MNRIASESSDAVRSRFKQIVLTAPDIDAGVFRQLATVLPNASEQVTLYASGNDLALRASEAVQGYQRAGDTHPSVTIVPGVTTIDVSAVDTSFIGHFYYAEARSVLTDLFYLLKEGFMPDQRAHLQARGQPPNRYWVFVR
jgi:esterase/lipase superfamily enzyme